MRNVAAPLVIAWIGAEGRVVGVERMAPGEGGYQPPEPVTAALEVVPAEAERLDLRPSQRVRPVIDAALPGAP